MTKHRRDISPNRCKAQRGSGVYRLYYTFLTPEQPVRFPPPTTPAATPELGRASRTASKRVELRFQLARPHESQQDAPDAALAIDKQVGGHVRDAIGIRDLTIR